MNAEQFLEHLGGGAQYPAKVEDWCALPEGWEDGDGGAFVVIPTEWFEGVHRIVPTEQWDDWSATIDGARDTERYDDDRWGGYPPPTMVDPMSITTTVQESVRGDAVAWYIERGVWDLFDRDGWYGNTSALAIRMPGGELVIVEGNHRWIASRLRGDDLMPVQIIHSAVDLRLAVAA